MKNQLLDKKILIIGSNSYIGKSLVSELLKWECKIFGISSTPCLQNQNAIEFHKIDWTDHHVINAVISKLNPNYIIHLAANKKRTASAEENIKIVEDNVELSKSIIDCALSLKDLRKFIFFGTCDEYGMSRRPYSEKSETIPINSYGKSKLIISNLILKLIETQSFPGIIVRPSVVYGPGQPTDMMVSELISELLAGKPFAMSPGEQTRDYVYIDDLNSATISLLLSDQVGVFNIASAEIVKMKDVAKMVTDYLNLNFSKNILLGAFPLRENEILDYSVSIEKIHELIGWQPKTQLELGLSKTIEFHKNKFKK